jgi:uncharacterized membrane protein
MERRLKLAHRHLYHHGRFYAAIALGLAVYAGMRLLEAPQPAAAAGDAFFLAYLAAGARLLRHSTTEDLKRRAAQEDEGILIVVAIALLIIAFNIAGIFVALDLQQRPGPLSLFLLLAAAPLGWFMLHTISAFHYANLYYFDPSGGDSAGRVLSFPGRKDPDLWDFFYFSFVIGMTFQVSDVQIRTTGMRRAVLAHSIVSFFFATVLIALVVNVVAGRH